MYTAQIRKRSKVWNTTGVPTASHAHTLTYGLGHLENTSKACCQRWGLKHQISLLETHGTLLELHGGHRGNTDMMRNKSLQIQLMSLFRKQLNDYIIYLTLNQAILWMSSITLIYKRQSPYMKWTQHALKEEEEEEFRLKLDVSESWNKAS